MTEAEERDSVQDQLCARIEELEKEKLELNEQLDALQKGLAALAAPAVQGELVAVPEGWSVQHIDDPSSDGYLVKGPGISYCVWKDREAWLYLFFDAMLAAAPKPESQP